MVADLACNVLYSLIVFPSLQGTFHSKRDRHIFTMNTLVLGALAIAGVAAQGDIYTATQSASVAAAQATAKTSQPTSNVKGKVRSTESYPIPITQLTTHNRSSIATCRSGSRTPITKMPSVIPTLLNTSGRGSCLQ
jgi:hypothetical protein